MLEKEKEELLLKKEQENKPKSVEQLLAELKIALENQKKSNGSNQ